MRSIKRHIPLYVLLIPGLIYFVIFCYVPMYGVTIAFKDFNLQEGILGSPWVGFKHFQVLFNDPYFYTVFSNTIIISLLKLVFGFPAPILFAVLLNEVTKLRFKQFVQTASYLPHFISWIVLAGILKGFLSLEGTVNTLLSFFGADPKIFLSDPNYFRLTLVVSDIWKEFGWGAVIYFAAIASIDKSLYEAASIDGATRMQRIRYITLPGISYIIVIMLILRMSTIMDAGFDQIFNLYNVAVMEVSDVIDTYVYRIGMKQVQFSLSTTVNIFKSVIALVLIVITNRIVKRIDRGGDSTLW